MPLTHIPTDGTLDVLAAEISFLMMAGDKMVRCMVRYDALDALESTPAPNSEDRLKRFARHRSEIEDVVSRKYDEGDSEPLVTSSDIFSQGQQNPSE